MTPATAALYRWAYARGAVGHYPTYLSVLQLCGVAFILAGVLTVAVRRAAPRPAG